MAFGAPRRSSGVDQATGFSEGKDEMIPLALQLDSEMLPLID